MKHLQIYACMILLILFSNSIIAQDDTKIKDDKMKDDKMKVKDDKIKTKDDKIKMKEQGLPYKANYSSNFSIGKGEYSHIILDLWKDWDENAFERHDYMSDTLMMIFSNGQVIRGKKEAMEAAKKIRGGLTSAVSTIDVWIPLHSNDKQENWVAIWGQEEDVYPDGKKDKREIHEVWRFNKDGKVDFMKQFTAVASPSEPTK